MCVIIRRLADVAGMERSSGGGSSSGGEKNSGSGRGFSSIGDDSCSGGGFVTFRRLCSRWSLQQCHKRTSGWQRW